MVTTTAYEEYLRENKIDTMMDKVEEGKEAENMASLGLVFSLCTGFIIAVLTFVLQIRLLCF